MTTTGLNREQVFAIIDAAGPYRSPLMALHNSMWKAFHRSRQSRFIAAGMATEASEKFRQQSDDWAPFFVAAAGGRYVLDAVEDCIDSVEYRVAEIARRIVENMFEGEDGPFDRRPIPESVAAAIALNRAELFPDTTPGHSVFGTIVSAEEADILVPYLQERYESIKERRR